MSTWLTHPVMISTSDGTAGQNSSTMASVNMSTDLGVTIFSFIGTQTAIAAKSVNQVEPNSASPAATRNSVSSKKSVKTTAKSKFTSLFVTDKLKSTVVKRSTNRGRTIFEKSTKFTVKQKPKNTSSVTHFTNASVATKPAPVKFRNSSEKMSFFASQIITNKETISTADLIGSTFVTTKNNNISLVDESINSSITTISDNLPLTSQHIGESAVIKVENSPVANISVKKILTTKSYDYLTLNKTDAMLVMTNSTNFTVTERNVSKRITTKPKDSSSMRTLTNKSESVSPKFGGLFTGEKKPISITTTIDYNLPNTNMSIFEQQVTTPFSILMTKIPNSLPLKTNPQNLSATLYMKSSLATKKRVNLSTREPGTKKIGISNFTTDANFVTESNAGISEKLKTSELNKTSIFSNTSIAKDDSSKHVGSTIKPSSLNVTVRLLNKPVATTELSSYFLTEKFFNTLFMIAAESKVGKNDSVNEPPMTTTDLVTLLREPVRETVPVNNSEKEETVIMSFKTKSNIIGITNKIVTLPLVIWSKNSTESFTLTNKSLVRNYSDVAIHFKTNNALRLPIFKNDSSIENVTNRPTQIAIIVNNVSTPDKLNVRSFEILSQNVSTVDKLIKPTALSMASNLTILKLTTVKRDTVSGEEDRPTSKINAMTSKKVFLINNLTISVLTKSSNKDAVHQTTSLNSWRPENSTNKSTQTKSNEDLLTTKGAIAKTPTSVALQNKFTSTHNITKLNELFMTNNFSREFANPANLSTTVIKTFTNEPSAKFILTKSGYLSSSINTSLSKTTNWLNSVLTIKRIETAENEGSEVKDSFNKAKTHKYINATKEYSATHLFFSKLLVTTLKNLLVTDKSNVELLANTVTYDPLVTNTPLRKQTTNTSTVGETAASESIRPITAINNISLEDNYTESLMVDSGNVSDDLMENEEFTREFNATMFKNSLDEDGSINETVVTMQTESFVTNNLFEVSVTMSADNLMTTSAYLNEPSGIQRKNLSVTTSVPKEIDNASLTEKNSKELENPQPANFNTINSITNEIIADSIFTTNSNMEDDIVDNNTVLIDRSVELSTVNERNTLIMDAETNESPLPIDVLAIDVNTTEKFVDIPVTSAGAITDEFNILSNNWQAKENASIEDQVITDEIANKTAVTIENKTNRIVTNTDVPYKAMDEITTRTDTRTGDKNDVIRNTMGWTDNTTTNANIDVADFTMKTTNITTHNEENNYIMNKTNTTVDHKISEPMPIASNKTVNKISTNMNHTVITTGNKQTATVSKHYNLEQLVTEHEKSLQYKATASVTTNKTTMVENVTARNVITTVSGTMKNSIYRRLIESKVTNHHETETIQDDGLSKVVVANTSNTSASGVENNFNFTISRHQHRIETTNVPAGKLIQTKSNLQMPVRQDTMKLIGIKTTTDLYLLTSRGKTTLDFLTKTTV